MWPIRKSESAAAQRLQIRARLQKGETLHISFSDKPDARDLDIEGSGEIRLAIRSGQQIKAEVIRND